MGTDEPRVEVVVDGDGAEGCLQRGAEEASAGEPPDPRPRAGEERGHERRQRDDDRDPGDDPIRELDDRVEAVRRQRLARLAARPVLAAEARARQPYRRAGRDDDDEHQRVRECKPPERPRRQREAAQTRQRRVHRATVAACFRAVR